MSKVCIIGSGPSGMIVQKHFQPHVKSGKIKKLKIFESRSSIGGQWQKDKFDPEHPEILTPIYKHLYSNIPDLSLGFLDLAMQIEKDTCQFCDIDNFNDYFLNYDEKHDLSQNVTFNTKVLEVEELDKITNQPKKTDKKSTSVFKVTSLDTKTDITTTEIYDKIVVCVGNYKQPLWGGIDIQQARKIFSGKIIHSYDFFTAQELLDQGFKKVCVIGPGSSGSDIILEFANLGCTPIVSSHAPLENLSYSHSAETNSSKRSNILFPAGQLIPYIEKNVGAPAKFYENGFIDELGEKVECDLIVCATGIGSDHNFMKMLDYDENYYFLDKATKNRPAPCYLNNLHKYNLKSLCFMGLLKKFPSTINPVLDMQARHLSYLWFDEQGQKQAEKMIENLDDSENCVVEKWLSTELERAKETIKFLQQIDYFRDFDQILEGSEYQLTEEELFNRQRAVDMYAWCRTVVAADLVGYKQMKISGVDDKEKYQEIMAKVNSDLDKIIAELTSN